MTTSEIVALNYIDDHLRQKSYISAIATGLTFTTGICFFLNLSFKGDTRPGYVALKVLIASGALLNIKKVSDLGSHLGIFFSMPTVFNILNEGVPEDGLIRKMTQEFIEEIRQKNIKP